MRNIVSATTALDTWQRLRSSYQTADVVSLVRTRKQFFSHQMSEDDTAEEHVHTMQGFYDRLLFTRFLGTEAMAKTIHSKILAEGQRQQSRDEDKGLAAKTKKGKGKESGKTRKECNFCKRKGHPRPTVGQKLGKTKRPKRPRKRKRKAHLASQPRKRP